MHKTLTNRHGSVTPCPGKVKPLQSDYKVKPLQSDYKVKQLLSDYKVKPLQNDVIFAYLQLFPICIS